MPRPRIRQFFRHGFLPQLLAFEACARLGSVTRAAEELALAQPTVSGMLRKLSDTIGHPVLQSRNGRMEVTEAGRDLLRLSAEMLDCLGRFEERRRDHAVEVIRAIEQRLPASAVELHVDAPATPRVANRSEPWEHYMARVGFCD